MKIAKLKIGNYLLTLPLMFLLLATACAQQPVTPPFNIPEYDPNETPQVHGIPTYYYLVKNLAENEEVRGKITGCNDGYMVSIETGQVAPDSQGAITQALTALFSVTPQQAYDKGLHTALGLNNLKVGTVVVTGERTTKLSATVDLLGQPLLAGTCDVPRFKDQIQETIKFYVDSYQITLNGSEAGWRCLGDESGLCR